MNTCDTCKHWRRGRLDRVTLDSGYEILVHNSALANAHVGIVPSEDPLGICLHPKMRDDYTGNWLGFEFKSKVLDGIESEGGDDRGGNVSFGPKFGCVHHKSKVSSE